MPEWPHLQRLVPARLWPRREFEKCSSKISVLCARSVNRGRGAARSARRAGETFRAFVDGDHH